MDHEPLRPRSKYKAPAHEDGGQNLPTDVNSKSAALVVHVTARGPSFELTSLYHNVTLQPFVGMAIQYLFARFAWTVFAQSINFVQQGLKRSLCIHVSDGETSAKEFSGEQCRQLFSSGLNLAARVYASVNATPLRCPQKTTESTRKSTYEGARGDVTPPRRSILRLRSCGQRRRILHMTLIRKTTTTHQIIVLTRIDRQKDDAWQSVVAR